ncbi:cytochrome P450 [Aspergillus varians]
MLFALIILPIATLCLYTAIVAICYMNLHHLRRIPGPNSWIVFPILREISTIRGTFDRDLRRFHAKYGPVVWFGGDEVSFITADAWKDIYGHRHRQLPKALSHAFSARGLRAQEPILNSYVDKLVERLKDVAESDLPADMVKWYNLTTFDIIGDLAFGEPFGGLGSSEYHHWVVTIFRAIKANTYIRMRDAYLVLFRVIGAIMPTSGRLVYSSAYNRGGFMDSMRRNRGEKDGLTDLELAANSNILIIAGSETTSSLLSGATYWILRSYGVLAKVTREVRSVIKTESDITFQKVSADLPYLLACFDEAFRLYPPVPTGLQRRTLDPVTISGYDIPPDVIFVHHTAAYTSSTNFYAPDRFIPDRWLPETKKDPSSPFFSDNRDVLQSFHVGPWNCIGKNLTFAEMRIILAQVLWNFDLELCKESVNWSDQKSYTVWGKVPLMCKLKMRGDGGEFDL